MDGGELVPDSVVIGMIKSKLESNKDAKGFIFDGFPRTVAQAEELDTLLDTNGTPVSGMFCLEVEKVELVKRLLNRGLTSGRSDDADESVIENRINVYNDKTSPLINYYEGKKKFYPVMGMGTVKEIAGRLKNAVESI
jgi:adenylate kinase